MGLLIWFNPGSNTGLNVGQDNIIWGRGNIFIFERENSITIFMKLFFAVFEWYHTTDVHLAHRQTTVFKPKPMIAENEKNSKRRNDAANILKRFTCSLIQQLKHMTAIPMHRRFCSFNVNDYSHLIHRCIQSEAYLRTPRRLMYKNIF